VEVYWFIFIALLGGLLGLLAFLYHLKKGRFDDPEEPKYHVFRNEEEEEEEEHGNS